MISRRDFVKLVGGVALATGCGGSTTDAGNPQRPRQPGPPPSPPGPPPSPPGRPPRGSLESIEHIVFTMQENRSFDHYFGRLPQYRAERGIPGDVDGLPPGASNPSHDQTYVVEPFHFEVARHENLSPAWNESHRSRNRHDPTSAEATMDGFVFTQANFARNNTSQPHCDFEGLRAMGFYDERDLPFYYELASQFAISDRMFGSVLTSTLPNRLYLLAASSFGRIAPSFPEPRQYNVDTIFDLCQRHGVSWRIYMNGGFTYYSWFTGSRNHGDKIVPAEQFFADAAAGELPQVAMFESGTTSGLDEHPLNNIHRGAAYMERFFRSLMESPLWPKTAAFLTYDEAGGFYDHVPPPAAPKPDDIEPILAGHHTPASFDRYGFRVPFILVSPWARKHYVSHQAADHTSILRFIEKRFGLPSLSRRDAEAHDLLDMFDFDEMPWETPPALPAQHEDRDVTIPRCN